MRFVCVLFAVFFSFCSCTSFKWAEYDGGKRYDAAKTWKVCKDVIAEYGHGEVNEEKGTVISEYFQKSKSSGHYWKIYLKFDYHSRGVKIKVAKFVLEQQGPGNRAYTFYDYDKDFANFLIRKISSRIQGKEKAVKVENSDEGTETD